MYLRRYVLKAKLELCRCKIRKNIEGFLPILFAPVPDTFVGYILGNYPGRFVQAK